MTRAILLGGWWSSLDQIAEFIRSSGQYGGIRRSDETLENFLMIYN